MLYLGKFLVRVRPWNLSANRNSTSDISRTNFDAKMAQVAYEKPPSRIGGQSQLPEIKHPLSRLDLNVNNLDVRGYSRDGRYSYHQSGRPLSQETGGDFIGAKRRSSTYVNDLPNKARQIGGDIVLPPVYESSIPQNVEVMRGDPKKTKLPIFGK